MFISIAEAFAAAPPSDLVTVPLTLYTRGASSALSSGLHVENVSRQTAIAGDKKLLFAQKHPFIFSKYLLELPSKSPVHILM
jgi:hypothetical protein